MVLIQGLSTAVIAATDQLVFVDVSNANEGARGPPTDLIAIFNSQAGLTNGAISPSAAIAKSKLASLEIVNADVNASANIDASKIGTGVVSNTEFNHLNGVTSALQTQINGKAATSHTHTESDITDLDRTQAIIVAASDETTALTVGDGKTTFRMPYGFTLTDIKASVTTAPTGSGITVDVTEGGSTILSTLITIDAGDTTSNDAVAQPVISDSALADDAEIKINIDAVGLTVAGAGLKVTLIGTKT